MVVLFADDDPNDMKLQMLAAQQAGFDVTAMAVQDGEDVLHYLRGENEFADRTKYPFPDLIIIDLKMQRMCGSEVLEWLHHHPECAPLPTVMLSGSGLEPDIQEAYRLGVNAYFTKPSNLPELRQLMRAILAYWCRAQKPRIAQPC